MKFNQEEFLRKVHTLYQNQLSEEDIKNILELDDDYTRDTPLSTGKRLLIDDISFRGIKKTDPDQSYYNSEINYSASLKSGITIWVADNLKGKSTIFKIIKFALTGKCSLKANIKKWLSEVILHFRINEKEYTVFLTLGHSLKSHLCFGRLSDYGDIEQHPEKVLISAKSETEYQLKIEDFFFKQFSYYSLKWTQKNPQKDKHELIESGASWATYFKSIFLESKDSNLAFAGQEKKVFQILLGLELTYPINRLQVKKDMMLSEKGSSNEDEKKQNHKDIALVRNEINSVESELKSLVQAEKDYRNLTTLYNSINQIVAELNQQTQSLIDVENDTQFLNLTLNSIELEKNNLKAEHFRVAKEIKSLTRQLTDLKEYVEIGSFFSHLDIKHCPNCSHSVTPKQNLQDEGNPSCYLCHEDVSADLESSDVQVHQLKISNLEKLLADQEHQLSLLNNHLAENNSSRSRVKKQVEGNQLRKQAILTQQSKDQDTLKTLEQEIQTRKNSYSTVDSKRDLLISQKAVLEYRLKEMSSRASSSEPSLDLRIEVIGMAIEELKAMRFTFGKPIIQRLEELMLAEINMLGMKSISEVSITDSFDIIYKQDGELVRFNNVAEGEQLRVKLALYLSLIQLDIEYNFGHHSRLLIIDSPGKEEADKTFMEGFTEILRSLESRFGDRLQILIGTAERELVNVVPNQFVTQENEFVF